MSDIPFFAVGNDELAEAEAVSHTDAIVCPHCGGTHPLDRGTDEKGQPSNLLYFYDCDGTVYLAAVAGKLISRLRVRKA